MDAKKEAVVLASLCGVIVLLSLGGLGWVLASGMLLTIDGIFLVHVCLLMAAVFGLLLYSQLRAAGLLPALKFRRAEKSGTAAEATKAAPPAKEEAQ